VRPIAHSTKYSITTLILDDIAAAAADPIRHSPPGAIIKHQKLKPVVEDY